MFADMACHLFYSPARSAAGQVSSDSFRHFPRSFSRNLVWVLALYTPLATRAQNAPSPSASFALIKDAAQSLAAGDLPKAETELLTVLKTDPADYRALNLLGIVRAQQSRNDEAEDLFRRAIQRKPDFTSAHVSLGMLYIQTNRPDHAVTELQRALKLDPSRTDALSPLLSLWRTQARAAVRAGDNEKALALLIGARKTAPNDPDVLFDFGMVALRVSLLPDAAKAFQEALAVHPEDPPALYGLGRAQMGLSKFQESKTSFERYVQVQPADASGHFALGIALGALQQNKEARQEFEESTKLQPQQTEAYVQLGLLDLQAGNPEEAAGHFTQVLSRSPKHAAALAGMGQVEFQRKNYPVAAEMLQHAIAVDTSNRAAHYYLGLTYARLGRKEDSEKELQTASQLDREDLDRHRTIFRLLDPAEAQAPEAE